MKVEVGKFTAAIVDGLMIRVTSKDVLAALYIHRDDLEDLVGAARAARKLQGLYIGRNIVWKNGDIYRVDSISAGGGISISMSSNDVITAEEFVADWDLV